MKKKLLVLVAILVVATMAFAACGTPEPTETSSAPVDSPADTTSVEPTPAGDPDLPGKDKKLGIAMPDFAAEGFGSMFRAGKAYAEGLGFTVVPMDAKENPATQTGQIEDLITQKVDAIILTPVDASALGEAAQKAFDAGIPVALMDRSIEGGKYVALVESDNIACGYDAAVAMVAAAEAQGIAKADIKCLELQGELASSAGKERSEGFQKAAQELGFKIVQSLPTHWKQDEAYKAAMDGLTANPDLNMIFEASDSIMCDSVNSALDSAKKLKLVGEKGHIIIGTVDGCPVAIKALREKKIDIISSQQIPQMAEQAIDYIVKYFAGEFKMDSNETVRLNPIIGTVDNVETEELWGRPLLDAQ